jgi:hypothetical protein
MKKDVNLDDLLTKRRTHSNKNDIEAKERIRLTSQARFLATQALVRLHKDDFDELYEQAKRKVGLIE